ncbi:MAG: AAA family ATPase, partial [Gammaproteobacteria bacterium]|nr:AAA family ATPase [Gammaproteobacteria bacterium]
MSQILCSWIGGTDWEVFDGKLGKDELGPILRTLADEDWRNPDEIHLLNNYKNRKASDFKKALSKKTKAKIVCKDVKLTSPTNFKEIDDAASTLVRGLPEDARLIYLVSPGTYVHSSVWILLAHNQFPATLIEASKEAGVQKVEVPFNISVRDLI